MASSEDKDGERPARRDWAETSLIAIAWRAGEQLLNHEGLELSGYAAFMSVLAFFPFLIFLAALAGFVGSAGSADEFTQLLVSFAPKAVAATLAPIANDVLSQRHGGVLTLAIAFSLWTASSGIEALRVLLNRSYGVAETRPLWRRRVQSALIVVLAAALSLLISVAIVLGPVIWQLIQRLTEDRFISHNVWGVLRYGTAGVLTCAALIGLHRVLPNCRRRLGHLWPGAVVTTLLWLLAATLFSLYVEYFSNYSLIYGSLTGIMLTLVFFYLVSVILVFGAEVNAALYERGTKTDAAGATASRPPPPGA